MAALYYGRRLLVERKDDAHKPLPDFLGSILVTLSFGLLALAIVQGKQWGWTSAAVLGSFAGAAVLLPAFVARTLRHPAPVIEPELIRRRDVSVANAATFVFSIAFYALLLCNILFLTSVWHYSILTAGLAMTPAPFAATFAAKAAGELLERRSELFVCVIGVILFGLGAAWYATQPGVHASFLSHWLPGALLTGTGAGFVFPALAGAAVASLPASRFSVATGILIVSRQIGAVLGVALLVAVVGTPSPASALSAFRDGWVLAVVVTGAAAVVSLGLAGIQRRRPAAAPVDGGADMAGVELEPRAVRVAEGGVVSRQV